MRIALVHDYLREYGGAERVVEAMHEIWPSAPLFTSFVDWEALGMHADRFKNWDIRPSWVQRVELMKRWHSPLRFLTPLIWESLDLSNFDVVISSSGWYMSRAVIVQPETLHVSYIHHPPRNLYGYTTGSDSQKSWLVRAYAALINPFLRVYDFQAAQRPDFLIANSQETRRRIRKFYRRDATVIYPPIVIQGQASAAGATRGQALKKDYFLSVGRLTYSKRVDLIIEACLKLNKKLIIVGEGKEKKELELRFKNYDLRMVEFKGSVTDEELAQLYAGAQALIFAAIDEDFGMVPVEAMAAGTPVIAYRSGGVIETVVEGKTGIFFDHLTVDSLAAAIEKFYKSYNDYRYYKNCKKHAQKFSKERFQKEMKEFITSKLKSHKVS